MLRIVARGSSWFVALVFTAAILRLHSQVYSSSDERGSVAPALSLNDTAVIVLNKTTESFGDSPDGKSSSFHSDKVLAQSTDITREHGISSGSTGSCNNSTNSSDTEPEDLSTLRFNHWNRLLPGTRICRVTTPRLVWNTKKPNVRDSMFQGMTFDFNYLCAGDAYEYYTARYLLPYVSKKQKRSADWATRPTIVPPPPPNSCHGPSNSSAMRRGASKSILVVGNSHTRQVIGALICQYRSQFRVQKHHRPHEDTLEPLATRITFQIGANATVTLAIMINHPAIYSSRWKTNIEEVMGQSLEEFDAIVVGTFNRYSHKWRHTVLWTSTEEYKQQHPEKLIDVQGDPSAIPLKDLLREYNGPILRLSMFGSDQETFQKDASFLLNVSRTEERSNLFSIDATAYLKHMKGKRCTSNKRHIVGGCAWKGARYYETGHRCMGELGGEPDLVAHEVVEKLWKALA